MKLVDFLRVRDGFGRLSVSTGLFSREKRDEGNNKHSSLRRSSSLNETFSSLSLCIADDVTDVSLVNSIIK